MRSTVKIHRANHVMLKAERRGNGLRKLFVGVGITIASIGFTLVYGIAVLLTIIGILGATWSLHRRFRMESKPRLHRLALATTALLVLYVGTFASFCTFRAFRVLDVQNIIVFSSTPRAQQAARIFYAPLIHLCPPDSIVTRRQHVSRSTADAGAQP